MLFTWQDLLEAARGEPDGEPATAITGFSIDTRSLRPGDVFIPLKDARDGHDFVGAAFAAGASTAIVGQSYRRNGEDGALVRVDDPLAALTRIAAAARARSGARIIAVTGSAGKTGTKEALAQCLARAAATHAAEKSFNNHWGVPLTLARLPAEARFGVFEIGMNHAGEIEPLARLARPHVAVVTTVEPVHLEAFASVAAIAEAKAEIFAGVEPGGIAILNRDNAHFDLLKRRASEKGLVIVSFGQAAGSDIELAELVPDDNGSRATARVAGRTFTYRLKQPGLHHALNSLAVLGAVQAAGADVQTCIGGLEDVTALPGRGLRTTIETGRGPLLLIDESYNGNPASMRAALDALGSVSRTAFPRRMAVMGDMLELGARSVELHAGLAAAVAANDIDVVFASGPHMKALFDAIDPNRRGAWAPTSDRLRDQLLNATGAGDAIMVKGSLGSRMGPLVEAIKARYAPGGDSAAAC